MEKEEDKCKILEEFKQTLNKYSSWQFIKLEESLFKYKDIDIIYRREKIEIVQELFYKRFIHNSIHC